MVKPQKVILPSLITFSYMVNGLEDKGPGELPLLAMAYLDSALLRALMPYFESTPSIRHKLFDHRGATLYNLSSKIHVAGGLGLVDEKVWKELQSLCDLRDHVAHSFHPPAWADAEVTAITNELAITKENRVLTEGQEDWRMESVALDGHLTMEDGEVLDVARNDFILDGDDRIQFFCQAEASKHVEEPPKRRYLESYWTCLFLLMRHAINPWHERVMVQPQRELGWDLDPS